MDSLTPQDTSTLFLIASLLASQPRSSPRTQQQVKELMDGLSKDAKEVANAILAEKGRALGAGSAPSDDAKESARALLKAATVA